MEIVGTLCWENGITNNGDLIYIPWAVPHHIRQRLDGSGFQSSDVTLEMGAVIQDFGVRGGRPPEDPRTSGTLYKTVIKTNLLFVPEN